MIDDDEDYNDGIIRTMGAFKEFSAGMGLFVNRMGVTNCNDDEQEELEGESSKLANAEETECEVIE